MGKGSAPKAPDPKETAAAQTSTNVSTALANAALGNVNQVTPYGNLSFSQTGQSFINDENGSDYYYNPNTKEYRQNAPTSAVTTGGQVGSTGIRQKDPTTGAWLDSKGRPWVNSTPGTTSQQVEDGWQKVKGYYIPTTTATTTLSPAQQAILDQNNGTGLNLATAANDRSAWLGQYLNSPLDLSGVSPAGTAGGFSNLKNYSSAPELATSFDDAGNIQNSIANAGDITKTYGTAADFNTQKYEDALMQRLQPSLNKERDALETRAANQGIQVGSAAYKALQDDYNRGSNDARLGAILNAGTEQSRQVGLARDLATFQNSAQAQQYGQNANNAQFGNSAQQQLYDQLLGRATFGNTSTQQNADNTYRTEAGNNSVTSSNNDLIRLLFDQQNQLHSSGLNEAYAARSQPINEIASLLSGAQVSNPNFVSTNMPSIPTTDTAGITQQSYQNQLAAYQQKQQQMGGILGGLFNLGSSALMAPAGGLLASDRRVKEDIDKIGATEDGQNVYSFKYRGALDDGKKHIGLIAQEVEKRDPSAVVEIGGVKHVDYPRALKMGSILRAA